MQTSSPSAISYLDNGYVYVGSKMGDSWLVKLENKRSTLTSCAFTNMLRYIPFGLDEHNSFLTIVAKEGNLGPIVDFCALDYDGLGQGLASTPVPFMHVSYLGTTRPDCHVLRGRRGRLPKNNAQQFGSTPHGRTPT
jgi:hypothetical protein